jgi:dihydroorotate dehydrogenase (fumarate)
MIDLSTKYLGLTLANPLVCSASSMCESLDSIRQMEDAGASAVVLHSLFEEQLIFESASLDASLSAGTESYAESLSYLVELPDYKLGPDGYLEHIRKAKQAVAIPIVASLNGATPGGWLKYAQSIEQAGADALELNIYHIPTDALASGADIERQYLEVVREVRAHVTIPLAVKLSPFFTAPAHIARQLVSAGANALVLFNRFYQPDFDLEQLDVVPRLHLSNSNELLLRLHWVAIMYGNVPADLAITGGVHSAVDVIKSMMAGARVAMMTSALFRHGIGHLTTVRDEMLRWMLDHEYDSVFQMQGSMSLLTSANPAAFERGNYMKVLQSYVREH